MRFWPGKPARALRLRSVDLWRRLGHGSLHLVDDGADRVWPSASSLITGSAGTLRADLLQLHDLLGLERWRGRGAARPARCSRSGRSGSPFGIEELDVLRLLARCRARAWRSRARGRAWCAPANRGRSPRPAASATRMALRNLCISGASRAAGEADLVRDRAAWAAQRCGCRRGAWRSARADCGRSPHRWRRDGP